MNNSNNKPSQEDIFVIDSLMRPFEDKVKDAWRRRVHLEIKDRVEGDGQTVEQAIEEISTNLETDLIVYHGKVAKGLVLEYASGLLKAYRNINNYQVGA